jgi:cysteinyl-tRNA synthetase
MKLFNTMSMQKEDFNPIEPGKVRMYACGPTVYNFIHVGNARPLIQFDVLRRYLEYRGYEVSFVQNFTDVDDKIINRAREEGPLLAEIGSQVYRRVLDGRHCLGCQTRHSSTQGDGEYPADHRHHPYSEEKGFAYCLQRRHAISLTRRFGIYGKLSHQPIEDLQAGARVDGGDCKEDPPGLRPLEGGQGGEPFWESPGARGGRAGTSCARRCQIAIWGRPSIFHCGGPTWLFRT